MKSMRLDSIGTRPRAFSVGNVANCTGRVVTETLVATRWLAALSTPAAEGGAGALWSKLLNLLHRALLQP